jgi:hypothetical protein
MSDPTQITERAGVTRTPREDGEGSASLSREEEALHGPSSSPHTTLFRRGLRVGHSGDLLTWKIECDALSDEDWDCLASLASRMLPMFSRVEGVPTGGLRFAAALQRFASDEADRLVIADDVCTTGRSLEEFRAGRDAVGVVAFARSLNCPGWVMPIWTVHYGAGQ